MPDEQKTNRPAFSAPLYAALRQGSKEFAQILAATPESVRPVEEMGTMGNPTMQTVTAEMGTVHSYNRMLDAYASRGQDRSEPEQGMER